MPTTSRPGTQRPARFQQSPERPAPRRGGRGTPAPRRGGRGTPARQRARTPRARQESERWRGGQRCPKPRGGRCSDPCPILKEFPLRLDNGREVGRKQFCARTSGTEGSRELMTKHKKTFQALSPDDPAKHPTGQDLTHSTALVTALTELKNATTPGEIASATRTVDERMDKLNKRKNRVKAAARRRLRQLGQ